MPIEVEYLRGYTHSEFILLETSPLAGYIGQWCRRWLQEHQFNPRFKRWEPKKNSLYVYYDRRKQRLHVPVAFTNDIVGQLTQVGAHCTELKLPDYPLRKMDIQMRPEFKDRPWQVELIKRCSDPRPGMKGLAMQTGKGKTYSAIKSAVNLGYVTIVIVDGLVDQWIDEGSSSFLNCTTIDKNDLYRIQGFDSLAAAELEPNFYPKVFVASLTTMQLYSTKSSGYDLLPLSYSEFFAHFGIGTKIVDECHLNFHANTVMDLLSNVPHNLYCSATFTQSSKEARRIFERIFPEEIQYGMAAYDKYVETYWYNFSGEVMERKCVRARGYQHVRYEHELMKTDVKLIGHLRAFLVPMINAHYINRYKPGYKLLIFCSTVEFIHAVVKQLQIIYPDKKIGSYLAGDKMAELKDLDIIVSTPGKAGTGLDVKGLITVINTVSMASIPLSLQMFGRLRKIDDQNVVYVDRCDVNLKAQLRHAQTRKEQLKKFSAKYYEFNGVGDTRVY